MKPMKNIPKTESSPTFTPYPRRTTWRSNETWERRAGRHVSTCGVPYGHVHLAIADDDGCVLAESESEGWLHIAGDGVASGYLGLHGWEAATRVRVEDVARRCDADVVRHGGSREGSEGWTVGPPRRAPGRAG